MRVGAQIMDDEEFEYSQQGKAVQDLFVSEHTTHIFYVEDSEAEIFYERLFHRIFPKLTAFEVVCLHGKSNVRNKASENRIDGLSYVFVVDKDFDDLLDAPIVGLTYLDRYSIENYLADLWAIIKVLVEEYPQGMTLKEIRDRCLNYDDFRNDLNNRLIEMTRYFVVARRHWIEIPTTKISIEETNEGASDWYPMPTKEWLQKYRQLVIDESGLLEADLDLALANAFTPSANFPGATTEPIFHVPGKHLLPNIIKYLNIRAEVKLEERLGKALYIRILNHVDMKDFSTFKGRLLAQHADLAAFQ